MKKRSKRYKDLTKFSTKGKKIELKEVFDLVKKLQQLNLMNQLMCL